MTKDNSELLSRIEAAKRTVLAQVDLLHRELGRTKTFWKSDGTRVTPVDTAISENISRDLIGQFSNDQFFSEEMGGEKPLAVTSRFAWVLDPIDGTNNYALGIPHCAIALALLENGEPVYGVVYDLSRRALMHGGPGFGLQDGGPPRQKTAAEGTSRETLIGFHSPFDKSLLPMANGVLSQFKIRGLGSATLHLAYVAAELFDGAVDFNVKIWDLAAAIPLCRAAGKEVQFLNGEQLPVRQFDLKMKRIIYVAGNAAMCARLRGLMGYEMNQT